MTFNEFVRFSGGTRSSTRHTMIPNPEVYQHHNNVDTDDLGTDSTHDVSKTPKSVSIVLPKSSVPTVAHASKTATPELTDSLLTVI